MSNSFLGFQNPTTTDKKLDTEELTVGANTVHRERIQITGAAAAEIAAVSNSNPSASAYAAVVRALAGGNVDHDSADSGFPLKIGGKGLTANPTAVAANDRVNAFFDKLGKLLVNPYGLDEDALDGVGSATDTSNTSIIAAQGAGVRIHVTSLIVLNTSSTATHAIIKSATTERLRVPAPADNGGAVIPLPKPLRLGDNEALQFAAAAGVTTLYISAIGYKGV